MILKSRPVKRGNGSLKRVLQYITSDKGRIEDYTRQSVFHNLLSTKLEDIEQEFAQNFEYVSDNNRYQNIGLHLIFSASPLDREKMTVEIMDDIVSAYLERTYPESLSLATCHQGRNFHSHALVSSNKIASDQSSRISKAELKKSQEFIQEYIKDHYPELHTLDLKHYGRKLENEQEYYKRLRNPELILDRETLTNNVQQIFRQSESSKEFYENLNKAGYATYDRKGEVFGVKYFNSDNNEERKMRFSRLGIKHDDIKELDYQNKELNDRLNELEQIERDRFESRSKNQSRSNDREIDDDDNELYNRS